MDSVNYSFNIENQHSLIKKTILSESDTYESKVKTVKKLLLVKWSDRIIFIIDMETKVVLAQYQYFNTTI